MHWYQKLRQYFPIEEMKSQDHMEALLEERGTVYRKDSGPNHVLMYVEFADFVFVDYLLVAREARGQGLGKKLLDRLKEKGKPILLEVEPLDYQDSDTVKRQRFYGREGFRHASSIVYCRRSLATREDVDLEILFWSSDPSVTEDDIFEHMKRTYLRIHTYDDVRFYGEAYQPVDQALRIAA